MFFFSDDIMSSVVVRVDGICCLLSVAIDRSVEPNRKMKTIKKQKPIQRRKVLNLCTIFRLAKPAFFRYNGKLHWEGFYM